MKILNPNKLLGLLSSIAPAFPYARAKDSITKNWKNVNNQDDFDILLAAAYVRDAQSQSGNYGEARAMRSTKFRRWAYRVYSHWLWKSYLLGFGGVYLCC